MCMYVYSLYFITFYNYVYIYICIHITTLFVRYMPIQFQPFVWPVYEPYLPQVCPPGFRDYSGASLKLFTFP